MLWRVNGVERLVDGVERLLMRMNESLWAARGARANKTALGGAVIPHASQAVRKGGTPYRGVYGRHYMYLDATAPS